MTEEDRLLLKQLLEKLTKDPTQEVPPKVNVKDSLKTISNVIAASPTGRVDEKELLQVLSGMLGNPLPCLTRWVNGGFLSRSYELTGKTKRRKEYNKKRNGGRYHGRCTSEADIEALQPELPTIWTSEQGKQKTKAKGLNNNTFHWILNNLIRKGRVKPVLGGGYMFTDLIDEQRDLLG